MIEYVKPASPTRRLLLVVAVPLILLVLGGWQVGRGWASVGEFVQRETAFAQGIVGLEAIARLAPEQTIQFRGDPTTYRVDAALVKLRDARTGAGREELAAWVRLGMAVTAAFGAGLGLLAGFAGLAAAVWARQQSRRSRDAVQAAFSRVRVMLPWILSGQICGLSLAFGGAALFEMIGLVLYGELGHQTGRVLEGGLVVSVATFWFGWLALRELRRSLRAFAPAPMPLFGRPVPRAEAPGLWRMIDDLALAQGAAGPEHVVVGLVSGFFVTSADVDVQPAGVRLSGRTLHLPLPQLAMLDADETRAVIAHELAHFAGDDTVYSARFLPIYAGIARNLAALSVLSLDRTAGLMQAPAVILGAHIMSVFDMAVKHWSRVRELEADAASRLPGGPEAPARALIRTTLIAGIAGRVMAETAAQPQAAVPDLVDAMVRRAVTDGFPDLLAALSHSQPHPTDTHPPTIARIEALGLAADQDLLSRAGRPVQPGELDSARGLFADWAVLCAELSADAVAFAAARAQNREAVLRRIAAQRTEAETQVFPDVRRGVVCWALTGLLFGGIGAVFGYLTLTLPTAGQADRLSVLLFAAGGVLVGGLALWAAVAAFRSRTTPFLTLRADGFVCRGQDQMVPWVGVENVSLVTGSSFKLIFHLSPTARLPRGIAGRNFSVSARRRTVTIAGRRPRGMKPNALLALIGRHLTAAHAHAALHGLDTVADQAGPAVAAGGERREPRLSVAG